MEIIELTIDKYERWDDFCFKSDDAWFWHTTDWIKYTLNYRIDLGSVSKSFLVIDKDEILAICPLLLETYEGKQKEFSFGGYYGPMPAFLNNLSPKKKKKVEAYVFEQIDFLAKKNNVLRAKMRFSILNKNYIEKSTERFNLLMDYSFLDVTNNTVVIDLNKSLDELMSNIRRGNQYDIKRANKILESNVYYKENMTDELFDDYVRLHQLVSGKATRPKVTFDIMLKLIKRGQAFLVTATKDQKIIGFSYFFLYKNNVYYGSACNNPDFKHLPVSHLIQWKAIEWMKNHSCNYYELACRTYRLTLNYFPTEKEVNISKFKRGFGGIIVPLYMGEKYYDKKYFLEVYNNRINKYAEYVD